MEEQWTEERSGQRLILLDGTVIKDGSCGYSGGRLWCWIHGYTMRQAAEVFMDPEKTGQIEYQYGGMFDVYTNMTECVSLLIDEDGQISVCLKKGE
jgi:hypothetical protein